MTERNFTLGPLPWSEQTIERLYFADFRGVWAAIREHPGFEPHRDLAAVHQSFEILTETVEELFTKIETFDTAAKAPTFWSRPARGYFDTHVRFVRRTLFAATTAAVAWRDIVRAVGTHCVDAARPLPRWDVHWPTLKEGLEYQFVVDLRNCISHATLVTPSWQVEFGIPGAAPGDRQRARFLLTSEALSECDKLGVGARAYLEAAGDKIDLTRLSGHSWRLSLHFRTGFQRASPPRTNRLSVNTAATRLC